MIGQGALRRYQGVCRIYQEGQGCLKDGRWLFMWSQLYGKLRMATDSQRSLVECTTTILIHFMDASKSMWQFFHLLNHGECFEHFKTVGTLQGAWRTLQEDEECIYGSCRLSQITTGIFPTFISIDNQDQQSPQCDWGIITHSTEV